MVTLADSHRTFMTAPNKQNAPVRERFMLVLRLERFFEGSPVRDHFNDGNVGKLDLRLLDAARAEFKGPAYRGEHFARFRAFKEESIAAQVADLFTASPSVDVSGDRSDQPDEVIFAIFRVVALREDLDHLLSDFNGADTFHAFNRSKYLVFHRIGIMNELHPHYITPSTI